MALTSPFGLATTYGSGFVGRYQADKTTLQTININPAIAYRVTDWLSIGAGLSAQYAEAGFSNFLNSSTIAAQTLGARFRCRTAISACTATPGRSATMLARRCSPGPA